MSHRFLAYLRDERDRLNQMVANLTAAGKADGAEIARLRMLTQAVGEQIERWSSDLVPQREAA